MSVGRSDRVAGSGRCLAVGAYGGRGVEQQEQQWRRRRPGRPRAGPQRSVCLRVAALDGRGRRGPGPRPLEPQRAAGRPEWDAAATCPPRGSAGAVRHLPRGPDRRPTSGASTDHSRLAPPRDSAAAAGRRRRRIWHLAAAAAAAADGGRPGTKRPPARPVGRPSGTATSNRPARRAPAR